MPEPTVPEPTVPESPLVQAIAAHRQGNLSDAERGYRRALQDTPSEPTALHMLGVVLLNTDRAEEALETLSLAAQASPQSAEVMYDLGMAAKALNATDSALDYLRRALKLNPALYAADFQIGLLHKAARNFADAESVFRGFIAKLPNQPHGYVELGNVFRDAGDLKAALGQYEEALKIDPKASVVHQNCGVTRADLGDFEGGIAALEKAIALKPDNMQAWHTRALAIRDRDGLDAGMHALDEAIAQKSDEVWTHVSKAEFLFEAGRFPEGWQEYKWRTQAKSMVGLSHHRFGAVAWDGTSLVNRHVLLRAEQGVGEQVLFASMIPDLLAEAASVTIECEKRLTPLFARSFPQAAVINKKSNTDLTAPIPKPDVELALGDLGARFRINLNDFPVQSGYLKADDGQVLALRRHYQEQAAGRPIVGVSWRSFNPLSAWRKTLPLPKWADILTRDDLFFVDIQYGDVEMERADALRRGFNLFHDPKINPATDLDGAAAQIAALDAVLSTSNSCVHMAGALNIPTILLLPARIERHWYWFPDQTPNPWYPSVKVVRQEKPTEWTGCLAKAEAALDQLLKR